MCSDLQPNFRSKVRVMYDLFEIWFYAIAQTWLRIFTKKKHPLQWLQSKWYQVSMYHQHQVSIKFTQDLRVKPLFRPYIFLICPYLSFTTPTEWLIKDMQWYWIIIFLSLRQSKASKMHFNVTSTTFFRKQALNRRWTEY